MSSDPKTSATEQNPASEERPRPVVLQAVSPRRAWGTRLLLIVLLFSVLINFSMYASYQEYFSEAAGPRERYRSGERGARDKIAVVQVSGAIMPPYTKQTLDAIEKAEKDDAVKAVLLVVDSPGGAVADSHMIHHRLQQFRERTGKPVAVSMKRMAASGGYYISMGIGPEGKIFAEPTSWTGSIGVIIPRFDASKLAEDKLGLKSDPLKTGPFKDALSPFRELGEDERAVWETILDETFERFLTVIADNRKQLDLETVRGLATGQVYTAEQALGHKLIDEIGYEEDALDSLKSQLNLERARVVTYRPKPTLLDALTGNVSVAAGERRWQALLETTVPRAYYYCSWLPSLPAD